MENRFGTFGDNDNAKGSLFTERISDVGNELIDEHNDHAKDYTLQVPYAGTTTGAANTYAIATPTIAALTVGMAVSVKFNFDSTAASTLNWCALGAKPIKKANGTDVTNLKATGIYTLRYDGTNFILQGEGASGNATASDLISGKTATVDAGEITGTLALTGTAVAADILAAKTAYNTNPKTQVTGTMANNGAVAITPGTTQQAIATGYHNGSGYVVGDADLAAGNIKKDVNIFGVTGTVEVPLRGISEYTSIPILTYDCVFSKDYGFRYENPSVKKYSLGGSLITSFSVSGYLGAYDDFANEILTNYNNATINRYTDTGTFVGSFSLPSNVVVSAGKPFCSGANYHATVYTYGSTSPAIIGKTGTYIGNNTNFPVTGALSAIIAKADYAYYFLYDGTAQACSLLKISATAPSSNCASFRQLSNALRLFATVKE